MRTRGCSEEGGSLDPAELTELEDRIGHRFRDSALLLRALTHPSRAHEEGDLESSNERLEFLGDAVLDLLVSQLLMAEQPRADEGVLSQARAAAVNTDALATLARELGLQHFVRLGRGEQRSGGAAKASILANVFEAVLGALYLDGGLEAAGRLVERELGSRLDTSGESLRDAKTRLQEELQRRGQPAPSYATVGESGPDHGKRFEVEVSVAGTVLGRGAGPSKRRAEQEAARAALGSLT